MAKYQTEFVEIARHVRDMMAHLSTQKFDDVHTQDRADILRKIFPSPEPSSIVPVLERWNDEAPISFDNQWPATKNCIEDFSNDPARAIFILARLLAFAYIEYAWEAQRNLRQFISPFQHVHSLAAIQLGLDLNSAERDVLNTIYTNSFLYSELLLRRFETTVKGGIDEITQAKTSVQQHVSEWEEHLGEVETRTNEAEQKIQGYEATLQKYRTAFGFLGLTAAYKEFFGRKRFERNTWLYLLVTLAILILTFPLAHARLTEYLIPTLAKNQPAPAALQSEQLPKSQGRHTTNQAPVGADVTSSDSLNKQSLSTTDAWLEFITKYIPFAVIELLLVYFFRVALLHFNSTQAQLLQLEIKMAACAFIEEYVKFIKDSGSPDLSKFESLVFGGIVADMDKVPSTFDGLEQLVKVVRGMRKEE